MGHRATERGTLRVRMMRYIDWVSLLDHWGVLTSTQHQLGWENETFYGYEYDLREIRQEGQVVAIDTGSTFWAKLLVEDGQHELGSLERFAQQAVHPRNFVCEAGSPGRALEQLDWPPFYGWFEPERGDPVAFTSQADVPWFLAIPAQPGGEPALTRSNAIEHEAFVRARQVVQELMGDADRHLRYSGPCLPGPESLEEHQMEEGNVWYEDTEEEVRRRRASSLGVRTRPRVARRDRDDRREPLVDWREASDALRGPMRERSEEDLFESVFQRRRRDQRR